MGERPCNRLPAKRCYECGRRGSKAFLRKIVRVGRTDVQVWRCSNRGACGMRGSDLRAGVEAVDAAYKQQRAPSGHSEGSRER